MTTPSDVKAEPLTFTRVPCMDDLCPLACEHVRTVIDKLTAALSIEREKREGAEEALREIAALSKCRCEEIWTTRGLHAPECTIEIHEEARTALTNPPITEEEK
jgi:hypothetical protein